MQIINEVIHGDCIEVLRRVPSESVDLIVTDPPYGVNYTDRCGRTVANDDHLGRVLGAFPELYRVLKPDTLCASFYGWNRVDAFFCAWRQAGFYPVGHIVWAKNYASSRGFLEARHEQAYLLAKGRPAKPTRPIADVREWEYSGNRAHPTEKAVSILRPLIESFSRPGDLVLDPFSGSGSTSVAAALSGRHYLGIELESHYCEHARQRLAALHQPSVSNGEFVVTLSDLQRWLRDQGMTVDTSAISRLVAEPCTRDSRATRALR
ncbi:MAG: methylase [Gammaproteobacteria bacterium]|nr:methylase [Gammaproteobacteria bacterium]